jgi:hypothetical protein
MMLMLIVSYKKAMAQKITWKIRIIEFKKNSDNWHFLIVFCFHTMTSWTTFFFNGSRNYEFDHMSKYDIHTDTFWDNKI